MDHDSTTEDFLKIGGGVCQDFAHLMLALLRLRQVPCRYVSGYLHVERKKREPSQSHAYFAKSPRALPTASSPTSPMPALTSNNSSRPLHSLLSGLALDAPPELQRVANAVEDLPNPARPGKRDRAVAEHSAAQSLVDRQRLDLS